MAATWCRKACVPATAAISSIEALGTHQTFEPDGLLNVAIKP